ncbi:MAG: Rrf2 family transcriptional regulator [Rhodothermales bacterium]
MLLSKACEYGIRSVLYLTKDGTGAYVPIRSISDALGIPYHFLAKIVQTLAQADVLTSSRGPSGGVALARPASQIKLKEIVVAIDGTDIFTECVLGLPGCGERKPCPLHEQWAPARDRIHRMFDHVSLAEMAERMSEGDFRLALLRSDLA